MVHQDLDYLFDTLDVSCQGYIEWIDLQEFDETVYSKPLDIEQLEATINTVRTMFYLECILPLREKKILEDIVKEFIFSHCEIKFHKIRLKLVIRESIFHKM